MGFPFYTRKDGYLGFPSDQRESGWIIKRNFHSDVIDSFYKGKKCRILKKMQDRGCIESTDEFSESSLCFWFAETVTSIAS